MDNRNLTRADLDAEEQQLARIDTELDAGLGNALDVLLAPFEEPEEDDGYGPEADARRRAWLAENGYAVVDEDAESYRGDDLGAALRTANTVLDARLRAYGRRACRRSLPRTRRPRARRVRCCVGRGSPRATRGPPDEGDPEPPPPPPAGLSARLRRLPRLVAT